MKSKSEKPSPEAKALSLYLMAYKGTSASHKQKSKRINKQWGLVLRGELDSDVYLKEVKVMLAAFGGYEAVVENTVKFYIDKTGEWKLEGEDKYCIDAKKIAERLKAK